MMNTKILMMISAIILAVWGVALSFFPDEITNYLGLSGIPSLFVQLWGALYFGYAMLNWMAKGNILGGIYSRPIAVANFTHFSIGGITLIKFILSNETQAYVIIACIIYTLFALCFGYILFRTPLMKAS